MDKGIDIFNRKEEFKEQSLREVMEIGLNANLLRDNPTFHKAINDMYWDLTYQEDRITSDASIDNRQAGEMRRNYSMMRTLLTQFVLNLDDYISGGDEAKQAISAVEETKRDEALFEKLGE